jgi:hypothetical protein
MALPSLTAGATFLVRIGWWTSGAPPATDGVITYTRTSGGGAATATLCEPSGLNSVGARVTLASSHACLDGDTALRLDARGGPPGEFGFLLVSSGLAAPMTLFQGTLCLGDPVGRYTPRTAAAQGDLRLDGLSWFDPNGVLRDVRDNLHWSVGIEVPYELPQFAGGAITSGSTWGFQYWYRDTDALGLSSANLSNALVVSFP